MKLEMYDSKEEIDKRGADIIAQAIDKTLEKKGYAVLAVPGGRSVSGIFTRLKTKDIDWKKVHLFMIDERLVSIDDKESNFKLLKENLIDDLLKESKIKEENMHPFLYDPRSSDFGTSKYSDELSRYGGRYDIILLSSGEDCHVGALYPDHHSITACAKDHIAMDDSPKMPRERMSSSLSLLLRADYALLLFLGKAKKKALDMFLNENLKIEQCPARLVQSIPQSYVLTDLK